MFPKNIQPNIFSKTCFSGFLYQIFYPNGPKTKFRKFQYHHLQENQLLRTIPKVNESFKSLGINQAKK